MKHEQKTGLVLTGGGARAAYQVGCLRAISEITSFPENPFQIISGFSAGAINGSWLASRHESFSDATREMWEAWAKITSDQVFKTNSLSLASIAFQWIKDRGMSGVNPDKEQINYLLDTAPLQEWLSKNIDFKAMNANLASGALYGLAIIAGNYRTGKSTAFFNGNTEINSWEGANKLSIRTEFREEHIMASSAIPVFFRPIDVDGSFYGDGMVRLTAPLSPAIHMGANKLLVIGVRGAVSDSSYADNKLHPLSLGEIAGTVLNGLFFDAIDTDLTRVRKMNRMLSVMSPEEIEKEPGHYRPIKVLDLRPSRNLSVRPGCELAQLPFAMRFLLKGMGVTNDKGMDLLSYLAFEPRYMQSLLNLGYEDTLARRHEVEDFFV